MFALGINAWRWNIKSKHRILNVNKQLNLTISLPQRSLYSMAEVQPDPTDTGTLRPKRRPLEQKGDAFIPIDVPEFDSHMMLPSHITPLDTLGIFS